MTNLLLKFLENSDSERQWKLLNIFNNSSMDCASFFNSTILIQMFNNAETNKGWERTFLSAAELINKWINDLKIEAEYSIYEATFFRLLQYISKPFESLNIDVTVSALQTLDHIFQRREAIQYLKANFHYALTVESMIGKDPKLCSSALVTIHTLLATLDDTIVNRILRETTYLHKIKNILNTPYDADILLKKEIFLGLSNVAAGTREHVDLLLNDPQLIARTILYLKESPCLSSRKEIIWLLGNLSITKCGANYCTDQMLTNPDLLSAIFDLAENNQLPAIGNGVLREFFENILQCADSFVAQDDTTQYNPIAVKIFECGAIDKLPYLKSGRIMKYFGETFEAFLAQKRRQNTKRAVQ